jgi:hypothetical protein
MHVETHRPTPRNPRWWRDNHTSTWDRVKAALQRDWEQTKSDFTDGKKGRDLNQGADDTLAQATGKQAIPPMGVPNPLTPEEIHAAAEKAERQFRKDAEKVSREMEQANREAPRRAAIPWQTAEEPIRYGYMASQYYSGDWDETLERKLRNEWGDTYLGRSWDEDREVIRHGWNQGRRQG